MFSRNKFYLLTPEEYSEQANEDIVELCDENFNIFSGEMENLRKENSLSCYAPVIDRLIRETLNKPQSQRGS